MKYFDQILVNQMVKSNIYLRYILILFISINSNVIAQSIIFKGQPIKLTKALGQNGNAELHGKINGKKIIAITNKHNAKNKGRYLGAFRTLNKSQLKLGNNKLITYHVFEKD